VFELKGKNSGVWVISDVPSYNNFSRVEIVRFFQCVSLIRINRVRKMGELHRVCTPVCPCGYVRRVLLSSSITSSNPTDKATTDYNSSELRNSRHSSSKE